jgi:hypothetical protein
MLLVLPEVIHGATGGFPIPGPSVLHVVTRVDELADRGDQSSGGDEGNYGLLFRLGFQVVEEVVHGLLLEIG